MKKPKPIILPKAKKRNFSAKQAVNQKAGAMKERKDRGGARNTFREDLRQSE